MTEVCVLVGLVYRTENRRNSAAAAIYKFDPGSSVGRNVWDDVGPNMHNLAFRMDMAGMGQAQTLERNHGVTTIYRRDWTVYSTSERYVRRQRLIMDSEKIATMGLTGLVEPHLGIASMSAPVRMSDLASESGTQLHRSILVYPEGEDPWIMPVV